MFCDLLLMGFSSAKHVGHRLGCLFMVRRSWSTAENGRTWMKLGIRETGGNV